MTSITLPVHIQLRDWAMLICSDLDEFGPFGPLTDDARWQEWAMQFFGNAALGRNLPDPYWFTDWREWAERFAQGLA